MIKNCLIKFQAQKILLVNSINTNLTQTLLETRGKMKLPPKPFYEVNIALIQKSDKNITNRLQTNIPYDYRHKNQSILAN